MSMSMKPDTHSPESPLPRRSAGPYIRPMQGWWKRNPFFIRYMVRELTAVAVWVYALILTVGVFRLGQGESAWNGWVEALQSPLSIALHMVLLVGMLVHTQSWFQIMPKTMAPIVIRGERVSAERIQRTGWSVAAVVCVLALLLASWSQS
jgi:fumarate reductase subunit C